MNVFEREKCRLRLLIHPWIHIGCCLGFIVCILASPSTADEQLASDRSILDSVVENVANLGVQVQALPTSGVENIEVALPDDVNGAAESMTASEGEFWEDWVSPSRLSGSLRVLAVMSALSLAPALLLMTTCYVRLIVVLSLLRHAIGNQQLPPNQVTTTLAIFLTGIIMWPVWMSVHEQAVIPYTDPDISMTPSEAWTAGISPIR